MNNIFRKDFIINKGDIKTHSSFKFQVADKEAQALRLEFDYFPMFVNEVESIVKAFKNGCCSLNAEESSLLKDRCISGKDKLRNLVTLSLYFEEEYIGCAHRHNGNQKILISPQESTAGFIRTPIGAGQWEIVISMHGVFSDNMRINMAAYTE